MNVTATIVWCRQGLVNVTQGHTPRTLASTGPVKSDGEYGSKRIIPTPPLSEKFNLLPKNPKIQPNRGPCNALWEALKQASLLAILWEKSPSGASGEAQRPTGSAVHIVGNGIERRPHQA